MNVNTNPLSSSFVLVKRESENFRSSVIVFYLAEADQSVVISEENHYCVSECDW